MDRQRLQPVGRGAEEFDRAGPHADTHFLDRPRARDETGLREGHVARLEHQLVSAATDTLDDEAAADLTRRATDGPGGADDRRARELPDAPPTLRRGADRERGGEGK